MVMARMLDDLLDTARISTGKTSIQLEGIDFGELLRDSIAEYEERVRAAGVSFEVEISTTPCPVRGDPVRLQQIVDNIDRLVSKPITAEILEDLCNETPSK